MKEEYLVEALGCYLDKCLENAFEFEHNANFSDGVRSRKYYFDKLRDSFGVANEVFDGLACGLGERFGNYRERVLKWEDDFDYLEKTLCDLEGEFE
ncbi:hypothetical protein HNV12_02950 [Methanococcoides sp. SA1]|nr:hypothetical protein [Methanococcoides sp. SA1]